MKLLKKVGLYALTCLTFFFVTNSLVVAQAAPSQGTYDYFQGIVTAHHTEAINVFDSLSKDPSATEASKNASRDYKIVSEKNYNAYLAAFNAEKAKNIPNTGPADSQIKGIQAWVQSRDEGSNLAITRAYSGPQKSAYDQYSTKVSRDALTSAMQIKNGTITAGSAEANVQNDTGTTANAAAGNTNGTKQVADPTPDVCSLLSGNFLGCLDLLVAKLIKGVFLQIAGFLAWLSANMLNYAIQISILDFASWSPTSLYPIWIIIRQIVSLVVVFAGLYLGFMYIIGREDTFGKYIGWLAIFALFVNFSYPVTRALVDVSNVVSLNIYSSAVGSEALGTNFKSAATTSGGNTAGSLIISKLGLTDLFVSATTVTTATGFNEKTGSGFVGQINTTPGALAAVAFALYAAFVMFMATGILVMRAAIFSFLIVASPLLLVDAVVPKLGDVAVKMRKMFFEQLIVAPVFMLMLALTLKFMDVFQTGPLANGGDSVKVFFNLLMMTIMLHIMLKVTKAAAGTAGEMATNAMGKVGGFGLGVASGGAGLLARGSVGLAAARLRDSGVMDKMQGSRTGRGLYSLTNSLAQSTFDTRNLGMVNRGMASAGMGMGKGTTQTYDKDFEARDSAMKKKYGSIKDVDARKSYLAQKTGGLGSLGQKGILLGKAKSDAQLTEESILEGEKKSIETYAKIKDEDKKREYLESLPKDVQDKIKAKGAAKNNSEEQNTNSSKGPSVDLDKAGLVPKEGEASEESPVNVDDIHSTSFRAGVRSKKFDTSNATTVTPKNTPEPETV